MKIEGTGFRSTKAKDLPVAPNDQYFLSRKAVCLYKDKIYFNFDCYVALKESRDYPFRIIRISSSSIGFHIFLDNFHFTPDFWVKERPSKNDGWHGKSFPLLKKSITNWNKSMSIQDLEMERRNLWYEEQDTTKIDLLLQKKLFEFYENWHYPELQKESKKIENNMKIIKEDVDEYMQDMYDEDDLDPLSRQELEEDPFLRESKYNLQDTEFRLNIIQELIVLKREKIGEKQLYQYSLKELQKLLSDEVGKENYEFCIKIRDTMKKKKITKEA